MWVRARSAVRINEKLRFFEDGPILPDELLAARDEGQVIFFCGAGVSCAKAKLHGFFGLAQAVVNSLRAQPEGQAQRLLAMSMRSEIAEAGLVPADRIFGALEREFGIDEVRAAVAKALRPSDGADLSAHQTLLDLARAPDGEVRLVTTNFDLLFEKCAPKLRRLVPPIFPDPARGKAFSGVVHLHGCVTENYDGAFEDEFVLSPGDFGRAYLADRWATSFIRSLLNQYQLVFVGYTADDPPVQYLLEGLNRTPGGKTKIWAFQAGPDEEAKARWRLKGVEAISYGQRSDDHRPLWATLEAWAERSNDQNAWNTQVIARAMNGPQALQPFERGQVKNLISTPSGARQFAKASPPAEWICVFDPLTRYGDATPIRGEEPSFDPVGAYGLDDDPPPLPKEPSAPYKTRERPPGLWDAFALTEADRNSLADGNHPQARGYRSAAASTLPQRIDLLCGWIGSVCLQPAAAWWASGTGGLHPHAIGIVRDQLERGGSTTITTVEAAWRLMLSAWPHVQERREVEWFPLESEIKRLGWSPARIVEWSKIATPFVTASRPYGYAGPPSGAEEVDLSRLVNVDVAYPDIDLDHEVPTNFLPLFVEQYRRVLETGVRAELETSGYELGVLPPTSRDDSPGEDDYSRTHGIGGLFFGYLATLERLLAVDRAALRKEVAAWLDGGSIFSRLRIWAASRTDGFSGPEAARILLAIPDTAFWDFVHQRDLLVVLKVRWPDFPISLRRRLERRIRRGPVSAHLEKRVHFRERRARAVLTRLLWLSDEGCDFSFDLNSEVEALKRSAPHWRDDYAKGAARSFAGKSGWVGSDPETRGLESEPLAQLLDRARELSGTDYETFVERKPLDGLAERWPVRMLRALTLAANRGEYPQTAWTTFLWSDARKADGLRLTCSIAHRLARLPSAELASIADAATEWMLRSAETLQRDIPQAFEEIWGATVSALRDNPASTRSSIVSSRGVDWASHAINSAVGRLAQTLLKHPNSSPGTEGFSADWLRRIEDLLALEGDARRYAVVILAYQIPWLHHRAPEWAAEHILSALDSGDPRDAEAFWAGFFWAAKVPNVALYVRLKPYLLRFAEGGGERPDHTENMAGIVLSGWGSKTADSEERVVTDEEMHHALLKGSESFRSQIIWQMGTWSREVDGPWAEQTLVLLNDVWPRQASIKSALLSDRMLDLAIKFRGSFTEIVQALIPLITPVSSSSFALYKLARPSNEEDPPYRDPLALLDLLWAVLAERASEWPYGADLVVEKLAENSDLAADKRLNELRLRLAGR